MKLKAFLKIEHERSTMVPSNLPLNYIAEDTTTPIDDSFNCQCNANNYFFKKYQSKVSIELSFLLFRYHWRSFAERNLFLAWARKPPDVWPPHDLKCWQQNGTKWISGPCGYSKFCRLEVYHFHSTWFFNWAHYQILIIPDGRAWKKHGGFTS